MREETGCRGAGGPSEVHFRPADPYRKPQGAGSVRGAVAVRILSSGGEGLYQKDLVYRAEPSLQDDVGCPQT